MSTHVLLIGGSRFLGREIARAFTDLNFEVHAMNRGKIAPDASLCASIVCDKNDRDAFAKVLKQQTWDVIVDTILNADDLTFVIETLGSYRGHLIHTGSLGVYGEARQIPATESLPLAEYHGKDCIVFNNKIQQDQVLLRASIEQNFPMTILRCSYICGPGDYLLEGWGGRSPQFFEMLERGEPLLLPNDGNALLHPGDVRDLGRAFPQAVLHPESIGQVYNIAGNHALPMKDYIHRIATLMGSGSTLSFASIPEVLARYPEITSERGVQFSCQHMCASIEKAREQIDWKPEIPLDVSLRETVQWMKSQNSR